MTTVDMLEKISQIACKAYKKNSGKCKEAIKLDRHEEVEIDGITFHCWREYTIYKMGEFVQDKLPNADVKVVLDGNNSYLDLNCTDDEQRLLNVKMNDFLKTIGVE